MNEYWETFVKIQGSVTPLLSNEKLSLEIKESAIQIDQSLKPCFQEIQHSLAKLRDFTTKCFDYLNHAEDVWYSKQRILEVPGHEVWEELGYLSGYAFKSSLFIDKCKLEVFKLVNEQWSRNVAVTADKYFLDANRNFKSALNLFEKDKLTMNLYSVCHGQILFAKKQIQESADLIINQLLKPILPFMDKCINQFDEKARTKLIIKNSSKYKKISTLVERAFSHEIDTLALEIKNMCNYVKNASDTLSKKNMLGVSWTDFDNSCKEVAIKLEKIIFAIFDELTRLVTQAIEEGLTFYNDFLERQARSQQEAPEQRQAEKTWIIHQRQELVRVQKGIEAILYPSLA